MQLYSLVPSAPVIKDLTAIDTESVHIVWCIPIDTNGVLSDYIISYTVSNGPKRSLIVPFNEQNVSYSCINNNIVAMYNGTGTVL